MPENELLSYLGFAKDGVVFGVGNGGVAAVRFCPGIPPGFRASLTTTLYPDPSAVVDPRMICPKVPGTLVAPGAG